MPDLHPQLRLEGQIPTVETRFPPGAETPAALSASTHKP